MNKLNLILTFALSFVMLANLNCQILENTSDQKQKYKFVFVLNNMECSNCYISSIKSNSEQIHRVFPDTSECYVIIQVGEIGDAKRYQTVLEHATIIETTEELDFSKCGITNFPGLIAYNEYGIPVKIWNNITQPPAPFIHKNIFNVVSPEVELSNSVKLIENDSVSFVSPAYTSAIINNKFYIVDDLAFKLYKIDIKTGTIEAYFNINDTTIVTSLIKGKYDTSQFTSEEYIHLKNNNFKVSKIYGSEYNDNTAFVVACVPKTISKENKYIEDYDDSMLITNINPGFVLVKIDTNFNYSVREFVSYDFQKNTKHSFLWYVHSKDNYLYMNALPMERNIGDTVSLLVKIDTNDYLQSWKLAVPYVIIDSTITMGDYTTTCKIVDKNNDLFVFNTPLDVFAKVSDNKKVDYQLNGIPEFENISFEDDNINDIIKKNKNIYFSAMDLVELDDSTLAYIVQYMDNKFYETKSISIQRYKKDGTFIKEKIYNFSEIGVKGIHCSGVYKGRLVFFGKTKDSYNLFFLDFK